MRILYVADGQNPHALGFISLLQSEGFENHLATTYPIDDPSRKFKTITDIPFDLSANVRKAQKAASYNSGADKGRLSSLKGSRIWQIGKALRDQSALLVVLRQSLRLRKLIQTIKPDLVHAFRLPYEGYIAGLACDGLQTPLLISTWGNDFTLYATRSKIYRHFTQIAMRRANGLHPDCHADYDRALEYGFRRECFYQVLPGNGGLDLSLFNSNAKSPNIDRLLDLSPDTPLIVNPRGWRSYVRNELFWDAVPRILEESPRAVVAGVALEGVASAESALQSKNIRDRVILLPALERSDMAALFARADITVSLGEHDGMPNSLLEAMACGAFPIALDLASLREVLVSGENSELLPQDAGPELLARRVIETLSDPAKLQSAKRINQGIAATFERGSVQPRAVQLYRDLVRANGVMAPHRKLPDYA